MKRIFIAGRDSEGGTGFTILGFYSSMDAAIARCDRPDSDWVASEVIDSDDVSDDLSEFTGLFFPLRDSQERRA